MTILRPDSLTRIPADVAFPAIPALRDRQHGRGRMRAFKDAFARRTLFAASVLLILLLVAIGLVLVREALPILREQSLVDLLTSRAWHPTQLAFGLLPFIAGSFIVTAFAMLLGVVPAVLSGIYLAEYTSARRRSMVKPIVDLLAGIPSVVYGLWGVLFVVPLIRAVTDEVLRNIPRQMRESALALGATRWEATWCVVRHAGLPGIAASVVLAFSRAFGETLAIMMVIGNTPIIPRSIFDAAYPLPALIANAYSEMMSVPLYQSALMLAALTLLVIVLLFNIVARQIVVRLGAKV